MSRRVGQAAEDAAAIFLRAQGFRILARNFTIQGGEIDLIAQEGDVIAFVEIKHRKSMRYAAPRESVTPAKQRRICRTALCWLQRENLPDAPVRFDIVESTPQGMTLLRGAFSYIE